MIKLKDEVQITKPRDRMTNCRSLSPCGRDVSEGYNNLVSPSPYHLPSRERGLNFGFRHFDFDTSMAVKGASLNW